MEEPLKFTSSPERSGKESYAYTVTTIQRSITTADGHVTSTQTTNTVYVSPHLIHLFLSLSVKLTLCLLLSSLALKIAKTLYLPSKPQWEPS